MQRKNSAKKIESKKSFKQGNKKIYSNGGSLHDSESGDEDEESHELVALPPRKSETNRVQLADDLNQENNETDRKISSDNDDSSGNIDIDDDAHSVGSHVAMASGTSPENSPPASPTNRPFRSTQALRITPAPIKKLKRHFVGCLIDTFEFPYFDRASGYRCQSQNVVKWKDVEWSVIAGVDYNLQIGFFLGSDRWNHLPNDWAVAFRTRFEILDPTTDSVLLSKMLAPAMSLSDLKFSHYFRSVEGARTQVYEAARF